MKLILVQSFTLLFFFSCGRESEQNNPITEPEVSNEKNIAGECQYNDKIYKVGERFQSIDQCNTCECTKDLSVICTTKSCY